MVRRRTRTALVAAAFSVVLAGAAAAPPARAAAPPPPLELFGQLPALEHVTVSPEGQRIAFVQQVQDGRYLAVHSLAEKRPLMAFRVADVKLRGLEWVDDDKLLLTTSATGTVMELRGPRREWFMLQVCDLTRQACRPISFESRGATTMNVVWGRQSVRKIDGRAVLFANGTHVTNLTLPAVFRIDLDSLQARLVVKGDIDSEGWIIGEDGEVLAALRYRESERRWKVLARRDDGLVEVATGVSPVEVPQLIGAGSVGRTVVVEFPEDGNPTWRQLDLESGAWTSPFPPTAARGYPMVDRLTRRVVGYGDDRTARYVFLDRERQRRWDSIVRAFGSARVTLESASDDFGRVAVRVFGPGVPPEYHVVDWNTKRADPVGEAYVGLTRAAEVRTIAYRAADGLPISAVLTLPPGREPRSLPLIVLPHGGPAAVDVPDFDWWAQAIASRGYVVLQPNFRGSSLDWEFLSAGFGQWGRKFQSDKSDGVRHLVAQGLVDPKRVCIVGASYGGYAALAGVALESGVYRCAVSIAGVSDLARMLSWQDYAQGRGDRRGQRWWQRFMGVTGPRDPVLATISPAARAAAVDAPVLLIHGRDDTVVPFEQSDLMADALRRASKPVELVTLRKEDHWLSRSETRQQMLQVSVAFLEKHNPP
jgi:dipeptidyl aminopeptidase/acylaminoacyl peptidase